MSPARLARFCSSDRLPIRHATTGTDPALVRSSPHRARVEGGQRPPGRRRYQSTVPAWPEDERAKGPRDAKSAPCISFAR